jgi:hypothetical protein
MIRPRMIRWVGHVKCMGNERIRTRLWWGNLTEEDRSQCVCGRMILKWVINIRECCELPPWSRVLLDKKGEESSTGPVWAAEFHRLTARPRLARFETYETFISLIFKSISGRGPQILNQRYRGRTVYLILCIWWVNKLSILI